MFAALKDGHGQPCATGLRVGFKYHAGEFKRPDDVVIAFGLCPIGEKWATISRDSAGLLLVRLLHKDQAYSSERLPMETAQKLAEDFLAWFQPDTEFFTNESFYSPSQANWEPLTESTFDSGVVAHGKHLSGVFWIEDED